METLPDYRIADLLSKASKESTGLNSCLVARPELRMLLLEIISYRCGTPSPVRDAARYRNEIMLASHPDFPPMGPSAMEVTAETSDEELDRFLFGDDGGC